MYFGGGINKAIFAQNEMNVCIETNNRQNSQFHKELAENYINSTDYSKQGHKIQD